MNCGQGVVDRAVVLAQAAIDRVDDRWPIANTIEPSANKFTTLAMEL
jgi:hypothetical protein